jgi:hypothetical protein
VRQLRVGDVVIVIDDQTPRGQWPLGPITAVFPEADGIVRSAMVRHRGVELQRPVVKLALLLPDEEEETSTDGVVAEEVADVAATVTDADADASDEVLEGADRVECVIAAYAVNHRAGNVTEGTP